MARTLADARGWTTLGTDRFLAAVGALTDAQFDEPSALPGWTRRHLVAHVAANADAIGNLVSWAATGVETPMYASSQARADGIEQGSRLPVPELRSWLRDSAEALATAMDELTPEQWRTPVVTAQGRTVPATETPWIRAREVCLHSVDLATGIELAELPDAFLEELVTEIRTKRGDVPSVDGPLPEIAAWLAGRPHNLTGAPDLGPWL